MTRVDVDARDLHPSPIAASLAGAVVAWAGYTVLISIWLPEFWLHPFGPLLKNIPVAAAILALILLDRAHGPGDR